MLRFVVSLIVISVMNDEVISILATDSHESIKMSDWPIEVLHRVNRYETLPTLTQSTNEELRKMEELAVILDVVIMKMNLKCGNIIKANGQIGPEDYNICSYIQNVDNFYKEVRQYDESFSDKTVDSFYRETLWGDSNLPDALEDIRTAFNFIIQRSDSSPVEGAILNLQYDCDTHISTQQQLYYGFLQLIMTEMKGLITFERIYLRTRLMNGTDEKYRAELNLAKRSCLSRLTTYQKMLDVAMTVSPKQIRRCDVENPKYGTNVIELRHYSRVKMLNKKYVKGEQCQGCPDESQLQDLSNRGEFTIHNCVNLGWTVQTCPAKKGSNREYLWWRDNHKTYYGHQDTCEDSSYIQGLWVTKTLYPPGVVEGTTCDACACSMELKRTRNKDTTTIWRISVTDQVSDVFNNMVVTGLRFVTVNNTLHLQIRQSNFSHYGLVDNEGSWKELEHKFSDKGMGLRNQPILYAPLRHNRKTLYLDDIQVPEGHAVVGLRFQLEQNVAFKLQVLAKPFDFKSGVVEGSKGSWLDAQTNPVRLKDYERMRIPIELENSDDPLRNKHFQYDLESNKMVTITHTDIYKDAGQTTLPLFHAEPAITEPPFPLGGIGISLRVKEGFGGYVAPRIYTSDISNNLGSLINSMNRAT